MAAKAKQADAQGEDEPEQEGDPKAAKPKRKLPLKLIIIAAAGLLVVGGAGAGAYLFFGRSGHTEAVKKAPPVTFVDLPDVLVNLANAGSDRTQYLKVKIVLELPKADEVDRIQPLMPRIMDAFQTYLRELRPTDLDGSAGLYRLKEALTRRVNEAIAPNEVTAVLFKEIIVQ
jgi:flagellar protein FliL